jgi:SAM-dependent methyltransferase/acyl carrier protein
MYRTGDIVRYRADRNIEYISRLDQQVKVRGFRIELGDVESVLSQHQTVREARVVVHEDRPGEPSLVAYLVPSHAHMMRGASTEPGDGALDVIPEWQEVWDETYREPRTDGSPTFNISGCNSSYTGLPIPADEVHEWVDQAVERVLASGPRTVCEIGCGTGLLLFRIAPRCERYLATDFSSVAVELLQSQLAALALRQVRVSQQTADDLSDAGSESVDAVVINSVVQYFPTVEYLIRVLEGAARVVRPGGFIFVGDVRSLPLLEAFHASVELYRAGDDLPNSRLRERVQQRLRADEELVIDPAFFMALRAHLPELGDVEIWPKRGRCHNEFTCFRYDVMLRKGPRSAPGRDIMRVDWDEDRLTVAALSQLLREQQPDLLAVTRVPNRRVTRHVAALKLLEDAHPSTSVRDLRHYLRNFSEAGSVDPETLWMVADDVPYTADVYWAGPGADDRCDVWLRRGADSSPGTPPLMRAIPEPEIGHVKSWTHYVNNPRHGSLTRKFVPDVSRFARERLPDYMVPSAFVVLDDLPLNPHGKLDRRTLPAPDHRSSASAAFVSPRTSTEKALTVMFAEMLGTDHIGVHDDFFADLRGHSLLVTRLVSRIREAFMIELPLQAVFESPTVAGLARLISESGTAHRLGGSVGIERLSRDRYAQGPRLR